MRQTLTGGAGVDWWVEVEVDIFTEEWWVRSGRVAVGKGSSGVWVLVRGMGGGSFCSVRV